MEHSSIEMKYWTKGAISGLRQVLAIESPLKMMKNAFYLTSEALFVLKIFKFLSWLFGYVAKWLDKKDKFNFKFYTVFYCMPSWGLSKYIETKVQTICFYLIVGFMK